MIGDSTSWAPNPHIYEMRQYIADICPWVAFSGYHSDSLGYAHEAEGGDDCDDVIARLGRIIAAPWYHLCIGHNDNAQDAGEAATVEAKILSIVDALIARSGCERVFVGSLLPYPYDPTQDAAQHIINASLASDLASRPKATFLDYCTAAEAIPDYASHMTGKHQDTTIQMVQALILASALEAATLPRRWPFGSAVGPRVFNLWTGTSSGGTSTLIPGYYRVSFMVDTKTGSPASASFAGGGTTVDVAVSAAGARVEAQIWTGYQGYGYTPGAWTVTLSNCTISAILVERERPEFAASAYQALGSYVDTTATRSAGELLENA